MKLSKKLSMCLNPKNISKLLVLFILILVLVLLLHFFVNRLNNNITEGLDEQKTLVLNHMTGCGHCEKLMPEWNKCKEQNPTNIKMIDVEVNEDPSHAEKYKIQGFPTILLLDSSDNNIDTYDGPRTLDGLLAYLESKM